MFAFGSWMNFSRWTGLFTALYSIQLHSCINTWKCTIYVIHESWITVFSNLKVHKHEIILIFLWTKIKSLYCLGKFSKKNLLLFLRFSPDFEVRTFSRWLSIRGTKFFWRDIQKIFFFKMFTWVLLDAFLNGFSKFEFFKVEICILMWDFWIIFKNSSMRMLSIRGNNFIAHWAY